MMWNCLVKILEKLAGNVAQKANEIIILGKKEEGRLETLTR
jgi:hypothetical protein